MNKSSNCSFFPVFHVLSLSCILNVIFPCYFQMGVGKGEGSECRRTGDGGMGIEDLHKWSGPQQWLSISYWLQIVSKGLHCWLCYWLFPTENDYLIQICHFITILLLMEIRFQHLLNTEPKATDREQASFHVWERFLLCQVPIPRQSWLVYSWALLWAWDKYW